MSYVGGVREEDIRATIEQGEGERQTAVGEVGVGGER